MMLATDHTHVEKRDLQGLNPLTPDQQTLVDGDDGEAGWRPTRKWFAALAGSVASILGSWIVTGAFDDVERGMVATALAALAAGYFRANETTPGGVPQS